MSLDQLQNHIVGKNKNPAIASVWSWITVSGIHNTAASSTVILPYVISLIANSCPDLGRFNYQISQSIRSGEEGHMILEANGFLLLVCVKSQSPMPGTHHDGWTLGYRLGRRIAPMPGVWWMDHGLQTRERDSHVMAGPWTTDQAKEKP